MYVASAGNAEQVQSGCCASKKEDDKNQEIRECQVAAIKLGGFQRYKGL